MKKGFTLVELLIVVSVISMLASIIIATTTAAQAKGRDAKRMQQIHQIDLATRLYIESLGHAPLVYNGCGISYTSPSEEEAKECMANSTPGSIGYENWSSFVGELVDSGFLSSFPEDPCGNDCQSASGLAIGYTYIAPLAVQYYCLSNDCVSTNSSYQVYAPLENSLVVSGSSGGSVDDYYVVSPPSEEDPDITPPSTPTGVIAEMINDNNNIRVSWLNSTDSGSGVAGYNLYYGTSGGPYDLQQNLITDSFYIYNSTVWQGYTVCFKVSAYDQEDNVSEQSDPETCINVPYSYAVTTPTGLSATQTNFGYTFTWEPSTTAIEGSWIRYYILKDGIGAWYNYSDSPTFDAYTSYGWPLPFCWSVVAQEQLTHKSSAESEELCVTLP